MKSKFLLGLIFMLSIALFANTKSGNDLLNIKINENVILSNGFGSISGKPILKDKELENKINLRGEFNVDEKQNASFEFNKIEHDGKVYNLNNAFIKKGRLKKPDITLKKDSNLTVEGGNIDEILNIINASNTKELKSNDENSNENSNYSSYGNNSSDYGNNSQGFTPS